MRVMSNTLLRFKVMAIHNAIDFIVNLKYNSNLINRMIGLAPEQIEDAINYYKLRCPTEQDAFETDEIKF